MKEVAMKEKSQTEDKNKILENIMKISLKKLFYLFHLLFVFYTFLLIFWYFFNLTLNTQDSLGDT